MSATAPAWLTGGLAVLLALAHLAARRLEPIIAHGWARAFAAGVSSAYVALVLLPEVAQAQRDVGGAIHANARTAWYVLLAGIALFLVVERGTDQAPEGAPTYAFSSLALAAFWSYYAVVGYLLASRPDATEALVFAAALGVHIPAHAHGLRMRHRRVYDVVGRWVILVAIPIGWLVGAVVHLPEEGVGLAVAFLAGAVILMVLRDEVPEERHTTVVPFLLGAAGFTLLDVLR